MLALDSRVGLPFLIKAPTAMFTMKGNILLRPLACSGDIIGAGDPVGQGYGYVPWPGNTFQSFNNLLIHFLLTFRRIHHPDTLRQQNLPEKMKVKKNL
jgi:hypothetical protein